MRHGELVQIGTGDDLVGAPADDYVADFVSEVPKADVLTLKWIARPVADTDLSTSATLPVGTVIRDAIPAVMASTSPVRVVEGDRTVGMIGRDDILGLVGPRRGHEQAVA